MHLTEALSSDALVVLLATLLASILVLKVLYDGNISFRYPVSAFTDPFAPETAFRSYNSYASLANADISRIRASYSKLGLSDKRIGYTIGYPRKIDRLCLATTTNARIARSIASTAADAYPDITYRSSCATGREDIGKVREVFKHFVRDWSEDGAPERGVIFQPILDALKAVDVERRVEMHVLVPGSGLGRLAWEISQLGFRTTANELSPYMTMAARFLHSPATTQSIGQHTVHPYAHWWSHQRNRDAVFRGIAFPDVVPRLTELLTLKEGDFLRLDVPESRGGECGYDYIVTLFFIDTSLNAIATIRQIYSLLKPGGTWINLGPLLWTGGAQASVELSLEEVYDVAKEMGFVITGLDSNYCGFSGAESSINDHHGPSMDILRPRTIDCEYTADSRAMMRWIYKAEFWVATKSVISHAAPSTQPV
ncbi:N2227-domain-containing protein [Punctularia strigosozonata HHB-11173 SS5]|uniref:N2227-domain-containing protein n=1 Tax=Punctularia strigosozonata (strain HHB-11173) TaxID=741275 RepID=UPI000441635A|nr:N2227-domain-containing protein [Punctularia strigosozonata HHB-11173 SS5]EIN06429.1 N2227-domain-containing protein [Punctularia strigosozonata HHB-11173 SS5]